MIEDRGNSKEITRRTTMRTILMRNSAESSGKSMKRGQEKFS
jgi:hypothetical protein